MALSGMESNSHFAGNPSLAKGAHASSRAASVLGDPGRARGVPPAGQQHHFPSTEERAEGGQGSWASPQLGLGLSLPPPQRQQWGAPLGQGYRLNCLPLKFLC